MNKLVLIVLILLGLVSVSFTFYPSQHDCTCTLISSEIDCHRFIFIMSKSGDKSPIPSVAEKRKRTLTEKALQNYEVQVATYTAKINTYLDSVKRFLSENAEISDSDSYNTLKCLEKDLKIVFSKYCSNVTQFIDYLTRVGTKDSLEESLITQKHFLEKQQNVTTFSEKLSDLITATKQDSGSILSKHSSSSSNLSNVLVMKQAQLEAAKVRAKFAEQEAALKKEKAQIMEQQKVAEAAHDRKQVELDPDI